MIFGAHEIVCGRDAEARPGLPPGRSRLLLGRRCYGSLIFALPPAEPAVHPAEDSAAHQLYFMCSDLQAVMSALAAKGVEFSEVEEAHWGSAPCSNSPALVHTSTGRSARSAQ